MARKTNMKPENNLMAICSFIDSQILQFEKVSTSANKIAVFHKHKVGLCPDYVPESNNNPCDRTEIKLRDGDAYDALNVLRSLKDKLESKPLVSAEVYPFAEKYIKKRASSSMCPKGERLALKIIADWIVNMRKGKQIEKELFGAIKKATGKDMSHLMTSDGEDRWRDDL